MIRTVADIEYAWADSRADLDNPAYQERLDDEARKAEAEKIDPKAEGQTYGQRAKEAHADRKRLKLDNPKTRRRTYREIALFAPPSRLSEAECRVLCVLLEFADGVLDNCFPGRDHLAKKMGRNEHTITSHLDALARKGWIRRHEFYHAESGEKRKRGQQTSSGIQFCVPAEVLTPTDAGWEGPSEFANRDGYGSYARKARGKNPESLLSKTPMLNEKPSMTLHPLVHPDCH